MLKQFIEQSMKRVDVTAPTGVGRSDPACLETEPRSGKLFVNLSKAIRRLAPEERQIELYLIAAQHLEAVNNPEPGKPDLM